MGLSLVQRLSQTGETQSVSSIFLSSYFAFVSDCWNVVVHVTNSLQNNGTGLHFHGIRQNWTDQMDGVPSITQCPIAPGQSYTYKWRAVEYGTGWYHSHFYVQAWDGVFGGIVINGPATANYDVDLGHLFLNDWYHVCFIFTSIRRV